MTEPIVIYFPTSLKDLAVAHFNLYPESETVFDMTSDNIYRYCRTLSDDLKKHISPHTFRHSFAVMSLKKGMDVTVLKKLLGHKNLQSTMIYTEMTKEDIEREYRKHITIKRRGK